MSSTTQRSSLEQGVKGYKGNAMQKFLLSLKGTLALIRRVSGGASKVKNITRDA